MYWRRETQANAHREAADLVFDGGLEVEGLDQGRLMQHQRVAHAVHVQALRDLRVFLSLSERSERSSSTYSPM
ncbi:hypothetical protein EYF80_047227 [Liparis tanakae]|uniref:Uncharacterized protein n=1 Tax=Liparis tanakae TaxID=230148 RepID=A0A4Z2FN39_9TELE|nr:hypothetical protein EYF80_047227 [Liparis tanakae]